ncbi:winged helix-turn-helix domain-containing protein [Sphingopyxis sp. LK2115]|uniref:winged helix-turn-helix domain-containing protein n=1 Tax=Sphingopyxis sp. LK2115 TaxID=2744558 RepID=UPI00166051C3|nr:winged helix-turn-helix domain-containing protein [Sphingopyxis sp. LK2115]
MHPGTSVRQDCIEKNGLRVSLRHRLLRDTPQLRLSVAGVEIDLEHRRVVRDGEAVKLSPREYDLLAQLASAPGKVLTHRQLLTAVWGPAHAHDVQYLRVFVSQLRQKLEPDSGEPRLILTEAGVGYRFHNG